MRSDLQTAVPKELSSAGRSGARSAGNLASQWVVSRVDRMAAWSGLLMVEWTAAKMVHHWVAQLDDRKAGWRVYWLADGSVVRLVVRTEHSLVD